MIIVKIKGEKYDSEKLQENSVKVRKWFAIKCIQNYEFKEKYYEISENNKIEEQ